MTFSLTTPKGLARGWLAVDDQFAQQYNTNLQLLDDFALDGWAYDRDTSYGVVFGYRGGTILTGGAWTKIANGTVTLADEATNYVQYDSTGAVTANTTGFSADQNPLALVVTARGAISTVTDYRSFAGGGGTSSGGLTKAEADTYYAPLTHSHSLVDLDDVNMSPGAGSDGYAVTWNNASGKFILSYISGAPSAQALTRTNDTNVTLTLGGSPTVALLAATSITAGWSGQLSVARGGTGKGATWNAGGVVYASAAGTLADTGTVAAGAILYAQDATTWVTRTAAATGNVLLSGTAPSWGKVTSSYVDGTVSVTGHVHAATTLTGAAPSAIIRADTAGTAFEVYQGTTVGKVLKLTTAATNAVWAEGDVALNELVNPTGDKTFAMTTRQLSFLWTAPSGNPMELEASGAYTGALLHIHQHTGNPGSAYLLTLESADTDVEHIGSTMPGTTNHVLCAYVSGDTQERFVLHAGGLIEWGAGGVSATDTNLYRSAANTLKTDDAFQASSLSGHLAVMTTTGDMIYSIDGSTTNRLPVGTTGEFLRSTGTVPDWTTAALNDLSDVTITTPSTGQVLQKSAGNWVNATLSVNVANIGNAVPQGIIRANATGTAWEASGAGSLGDVLTLQDLGGAEYQWAAAALAVAAENVTVGDFNDAGRYGFDPGVSITYAGGSTKSDAQKLFVGSEFSGASGVPIGTMLYSEVTTGGTGYPSGFASITSYTGSASLTWGYGSWFAFENNGSGTVATVELLALSGGTGSSTGGITTFRSLKIGDAYAYGGAIGTQYGIYISALSGASTNYAIYTAGAGAISFGAGVTIRSGTMAVTSGYYDTSASEIRFRYSGTTSGIILNATNCTIASTNVLPSAAGNNLGSATYPWDLVAQHAYSPMQSIAVASGDTTKTLAFTSGNIAKVTMSNTSSCAFTLSGTENGGTYTVMLLASGSDRAFSWATTIEWFTAAPSSPLANGKMLILTFIDGGGSGLYGFASEQVTVTS